MTKYVATQDDTGLWGVEDLQGGLLYESIFEHASVAQYVATRHSLDDDLEWDDIADAVAALEAQLSPPGPAPATAPAAGVVGDYAKGYDAGLLDGYTGVDADWVARFEARQADLEAKLAAAETRIAWADEILDTVEETAPKDWGGSSDPLPHDWYHAGQLVREYRAEYPLQASK